MRTTQTFILRLLADSDELGMLHGTLHAVASGEEEPFGDAATLLALLRRMTSAAPGDTSLRRDEDEKTKEKDL
ncbi:MAG: hypothetical protein JXD18_13405 [Anaerolineae bacterium]|nr:hypothetical protein [Anaerolineae bacterium]